MDVKTLHTKEQIVELLEKNRKQIQAFGVSKLGLFGSYAKDVQTEKSDVDFYVEFRPGMKSFGNLMNLAFFLEDFLDQKIDLLTDKSISKLFGSIIERDIRYVRL